MTIAEIPDDVRQALRFKHGADVAVLDGRRAERRLVERGYGPAQVSRWFDVPEAEEAAEVAMPLEGFSGGTPRENCERYAAGEIDRERLVDELVRFPYAEEDLTDGYDGLAVSPVGAFSEVEGALVSGLINLDDYGEVVETLQAAGL
jgi:hypothetical protein